MTAPAHVLITGADGYVGHRVARKYLAETDARLTLQARAAGADAIAAKRARLAGLLAGAADPAAIDARVSYLHGDLADAEPLAGADVATVDVIVHTAAVTRFNVERELAQQVNVDGTAKVLALAARCPRLTRLGLLSTVYASGLAGGDVREVALSGDAGFANHYEWSKHAAETLELRAAADTGLPLSILRTATVISDDDSGAVTQLNAVHNTLKLYYYGLLSLLPGDAATPVYLVTGDLIAGAVFAAMRADAPTGIFHVAHTRDESPTLGELVGRAFDTFDTHEPFVRRGILRPVYTDRDSFGLLTDAVAGFGGGVVNQALSSMTPFAQQLYVPKDIDNANLRALLGDGYAAPEPLALIARTCDHLIATAWGRRRDAARSAA